MVIRVAVPPPYCSVTRGIRARAVVEYLLGLPWNRRSLCCGIRARFAVESAFGLASNTQLASRSRHQYVELKRHRGRASRNFRRRD